MLRSLPSGFTLRGKLYESREKGSAAVKPFQYRGVDIWIHDNSPEDFYIEIVYPDRKSGIPPSVEEILWVNRCTPWGVIQGFLVAQQTIDRWFADKEFEAKGGWEKIDKFLLGETDEIV